jgi:hypothetical protein
MFKSLSSKTMEMLSPKKAEDNLIYEFSTNANIDDNESPRAAAPPLIPGGGGGDSGGGLPGSPIPQDVATVLTAPATDADEALGEDEDGSDDDDDDDDVAEEEEEEEVEEVMKVTPSLFKGVRPMIWFDYPKKIGRVRVDKLGNDTKNVEGMKLQYKSYWVRNSIKNTFARAGVRPTNSSLYNIAWFKHPKPDRYRQLHPCQKVNHFPASWCIGRKDRLMRLIDKASRVFRGAYDFHPSGFHLPMERGLLEAAVKTSRNSLWIRKPNASSCGRGISVVHQDDIPALSKTSKCLMQRYVANPYLIDGSW